MRKPRSIKDYGPQALLLEWEQRMDPAIHRGVLAYAAALGDLSGIDTCLPGYASLLVCFSGRAITWRERIYDLVVGELPEEEGVLHRIPVCYGMGYGPDLDHVARATRLSREDIIRLHTDPVYRVYLMGFRPGFAFLGEVDSRLRIPRRDTPRARVPAGAVGLAGRQTGIYPDTSPGGWQLIGHCPLPLLDAAGQTRFRVGDRVRFYAVGAGDLDQITTTDRWPTN